MVPAVLMLQPSSVSVRPIVKGPSSGIGEPRQAIARSADEWEKLWAEHAGNRERPAVDFSREMVVALFAGTRPTAGYSVEIVGVRGEGDTTIVEYRESAPPRDAITAQVMTSPFVIVAIPKSAGIVRFEKR